MSSSIHNLTQASILIVDPDPASLMTMASILLSQQYVVRTASSFSMALEAVSDEPLDLLISETRIEGRSGEELILDIRKSPDHCDLPVMFVSENQVCDVVRRNSDVGAAFYLKKPIDAQVICELVSKALWMPHLVRTHIEQKTVKQPHVSFAKNPLASPFGTDESVGGIGFEPSLFQGTPITF